MRCLAVCHTELVIRLLEAVLAPSAELDVLVESRALARKFESSELPVSFDEVDRIDSYVKLGVSPVMPVFIEDNGRRGLRKVVEAVRGAGGTLIYVCPGRQHEGGRSARTSSPTSPTQRRS